VKVYPIVSSYNVVLQWQQANAKLACYCSGLKIMHGSLPVNIEALLSHVPLFQGLAQEELDRIARGTREMHAGKGEILFHKGDPCNGFHLLVYGQIKLAFTSL
jgi:hypothetical protein